MADRDDVPKVPTPEAAAPGETSGSELRAEGGAPGLEPHPLERRLLELPPTLCLMSGLPATGKSWYARRIGLALGAKVTSSDQRRLDLYGPRTPNEPRGPYDAGRYSPQAKQRVYDTLLEDARRGLGAGRSMIIDGSFLQREWRDPFVALGSELGVGFLLITTNADEATVRRRLEARAHDPDEASEADWEVYQKLAAKIEPPTELSESQILEIGAHATLEESLTRLVERVIAQGNS